MSLATFKKKSTNKYSTATKRSGKPPGAYWLPQGPFGSPNTVASTMLVDGYTNYGPVGFSINGPHRSIPVGKTMKFSQQGTRFRGQYPIGYGGTNGRYFEAQPVYNAGEGIVTVAGNQWEFNKPSTLSTYGMLRNRFRWAYNGQYPNNWVQPNYTGNQTDSGSQGLYIHNKSVASDCHVDINNVAKYEGNIIKCSGTGCETTPARGYKMVLQQANAPYTKNLYQPQTASQHTLRVQRQCIDQKPWQKPFPYAVATGTGILTGGTRTGPVGNACNTSNTYTTPPAWYLESSSEVQ
jgi:hypothetical protein